MWQSGALVSLSLPKKMADDVSNYPELSDRHTDSQIVSDVKKKQFSSPVIERQKTLVTTS